MPTAWFRRNGLFQPNPEFDMEGFLEGEPAAARGKRIPFEAIAIALRGMAGESRSAAVARLVGADVCAKSSGYMILKQYESHIVEDACGKLWWNEEGTAL